MSIRAAGTKHWLRLLAAVYSIAYFEKLKMQHRNKIKLVNYFLLGQTDLFPTQIIKFFQHLKYLWSWTGKKKMANIKKRKKKNFISPILKSLREGPKIKTLHLQIVYKKFTYKNYFSVYIYNFTTDPQHSQIRCLSLEGNHICLWFD